MDRVESVLELRNIYHRKALMEGRIFFHKTLKNKDGSQMKAKRNGQNKLWKTRPNEFKIPVKQGLYNFGYIDQDNYLDWTL